MLNAYLNSSLNAEKIPVQRLKFEDFYPSERYFLTKHYLRPNSTVLDIGASGGALGHVLKQIEPSISYTGMDPDPAAIKYGKDHFPDLIMIKGSFPEDMPNKKYDTVIMFALFNHLPEWKQTIITMANHANKFINFDAYIRLDGTTVVDKDVSYAYYLDSGERVHQVVHNLMEIVNFLSIHEVQAKKISFYGYHAGNGNSNRCVPNSQQIRGNFLIELFESEYPGRIGGAVDAELASWGKVLFKPEIDIIIDGQSYSID